MLKTVFPAATTQAPLAHQRINIVGASGSGTSTLGRALAARTGMAWADADDFYWKPSHPPFQHKVDPAERLQRLLAYLAPHPGSMVSGSVCGWGSALEDSFDLVVFLSLPTDLRLARIEAREIARYGHANPDFLAWSAQYDQGLLPGRSRARHEAWLASRTCRVLRFEGDEEVQARVTRILNLCA
ncbi:adenylate kinase family enzyme [Comamonas sp. BIGb0152]|uniref:hypothetical protein n=1 Tax=Comamonas sp. BIGb0152 TaxID=2940601 RepID=UPI002167BABD|nr:hypothetical protein [Comamonas sp. BIGb0152]MCS4295138.1 adenylate kinase family enzyme [Comamonas sp. BIGb0152]